LPLEQPTPVARLGICQGTQTALFFFPTVQGCADAAAAQSIPYVSYDPSNTWCVGITAASCVPANGPTYTTYAVGTNSCGGAPTVMPTKLPTAAPSVNPTFAPSRVPTPGPTIVPSAAPSVVPTSDPSAIPTYVSTTDPSAEPTPAPSRIPSFAPSAVPTVTPTDRPTAAPSTTPTVSPSEIPTVIPSPVPSVTPTFLPTADPTVVPSFRPSAPTYSPTAVPTPVPTARTKGSVIVNTGFTVNSVNGVTLNPTSQETIKQSIANASQTTPNNVELVSVTRTDRRLLSSVLHRSLTAALFSYKVVAEIHFNLIDFPGLNESFVAGTKSKVLMEAVKTHEFDRIISHYATINNASQLMNVNVLDIDVTATIIPAPHEASSDSDRISDGRIAGLVVGVTMGTLFLSVLVYFVLVRRRLRSGDFSDGAIAEDPGTSSAKVGEDDIESTTASLERTDNNLPTTMTVAAQQGELTGISRM
jgi:hypothetical protein